MLFEHVDNSLLYQFCQNSFHYPYKKYVKSDFFSVCSPSMMSFKPLSSDLICHGWIALSDHS